MIEELKKLEAYQGRDATISMCSNNAAEVDVSSGYFSILSSMAS